MAKCISILYVTEINLLEFGDQFLMGFILECHVYNELLMSEFFMCIHNYACACGWNNVSILGVL